MTDLTIVSQSATEIVATVPSGLTTGAKTLELVDGAGLVDASQALTIKTFSPWLDCYPTPLHAVWAGDPDWSNPGDGNAVSSWRNESGGGDPAQGTGTAQPTYRASTAAFNGRPTVQFDGGDWLRSAFSGGALTLPTKIVVVAQCTASSNTHVFIHGDDTSHRCSIFRYSVGPSWGFTSNSLKSGGTADTDPHLFLGTFTGDASATLDVDGTQVASGNVGTEALDGWTLGGDASGSPSSLLTGHIAYVGIYAAAADLTDLVAALGDHYSITIA